MASGVHTNKPAKRYFLNGISGKHKRRRTMQRWWLNLNLGLKQGPEMRQLHLCPRSWKQQLHQRYRLKNLHQMHHPMKMHRRLEHHPLPVQEWVH
jgi:hypothetical protein